MSTPDWFTPALAARDWQAIIVAGSAGGVDALLQLLPGLPSPLGAPVICMLHLPANRDSRLAELFGARLAVPVVEAADKQPVEPGAVYFAGAGYHLSVEQDRTFSLSCEAPVHFARPAIDVLLNSAADVYGAGLAAILLTGANHDGADGMAQVHARGGLTVVQDPAEAQVATMPQRAIDLDAPDLVLSLAAIRQLLQLLGEKK
ncbi:chemotaxis protein CheB [Massilia eurypsychrophila]|jgi:two-component system chemotaxis response regulator CheB|uniref:protein-glutamate methylesterase n=1 Tax=Massilia eurypsychrophila TaxID=1485217 RepID=A0A2G8TC92_9BURK|nr:chemotaxis protein CheB [Massilia eurypsychrophila]PIL43666.1 chemotaxis protein CheB [Massilia eurypsychrophila]